MNDNNMEHRNGTIHELTVMMARVEANLGNLIEKVDKHLDDDNKAFTRINDDYRAISRYIWLAVGGMTAIVWVIVNFARK